MMWFRRKINLLLCWSRSRQEISSGGMLVGLLCCILFGFGLRLFTWHAEPVLSRDGVGYVQQACAIQVAENEPERAFAGAMPTAHYFYATYLASGVFALDPHALGVVTNIVLGSLLPLLFFGIAYFLWARRELALICAVLAAIQPDLVAYSIEVQREIPLIFFAACFFLSCILLVRYKSWYWGALMGIFASLGFICRYEGAELFLFSLIPFCILLLTKRMSWRKIFINFGIFIIFIVFSLWLLLILIDFSPLDFCQSAFRKGFAHMKYSDQ